MTKYAVIPAQRADELQRIYEVMRELRKPTAYTSRIDPESGDPLPASVDTYVCIEYDPTPEREADLQQAGAQLFDSSASLRAWQAEHKPF